MRDARPQTRFGVCAESPLGPSCSRRKTRSPGGAWSPGPVWGARCVDRRTRRTTGAEVVPRSPGAVPADQHFEPPEYVGQLQTELLAARDKVRGRCEQVPVG